MTEFNGFKGKAKRIDDVDIPRLAYAIGCGEDEIHAFMDVEAAGAGFDDQGRPKILYEYHVFYRNLTGAKRDKAISSGLARQKWGQLPYGKSSEQYPRLLKAMQIDETAALKACSWGLGQVLGENHKMLGYATPQAMVKAFMDDEEYHLKGIIDYLINAGIDDDLREHRWQTVARVYNGPGYAEHNYHGRMAAAYAKWAAIRDTPWRPEDEVAQEVATDTVVVVEPAVVIPATEEPSAETEVLPPVVTPPVEDKGWFVRLFEWLGFISRSK